ncbi:kinase-like protein [Periconia macrospinosa]|uniref:Kinase-like protein n=1 Tax=Periconia macrospinosa TaxID=97972 RepID=A0A2V1D3Z1_9PLEO|nr:kinase-like protein [Periconia macrospinosa]
MEDVYISPKDIPTAQNYDVRTSSFFQDHEELPTPEEVRSRARTQYLSGKLWGWKGRRVTDGYNGRPVPAVFEEMNLFVKWGCEVEISEAQVLYVIRNNLGDSVPVPEIYGWRVDGDEKFLYMEVINGKTMEEQWAELEEDDRLRICSQLRTILENLRRLRQPLNQEFVGNIIRKNYREKALFLDSQSGTGPFTSVKSFHDWYIQQYKRMLSDPETVPEPYRAKLPDSSQITFTHGDLHRSNIILTPSEPRKVAAIIDWEQSVWLPAYWEDCKARWTASYSGEWVVDYLPLIIDHDENIREAWQYYTDPVGS